MLSRIVGVFRGSAILFRPVLIAIVRRQGGLLRQDAVWATVAETFLHELTIAPALR